MCDIHGSEPGSKPSSKTIRVTESVGTVLAHDITEIRPGEFKGRAFRKGHVIREEDVCHLQRLGKEQLFVLQVAEDEMHENDAAYAIARALMGGGVAIKGAPKEGKISIIAERDGLLKIDRDALLSFNMLGDVMCATMHTNSLVKKDHVVAGTRAIPLVVRKSIVDKEEAGLMPLKINMVPVRGMNDDEISAFARLTFEHDWHVRFIEYMPMGRNAWKPQLYVRTGEIRERVSALGALVPLEFRGNGPSRNYRIEGARGVIGFISAVSDHFCGWCNRLRLTAIGKLRPCLFSDIEMDLRTPLRKGVADDELGRLFEQAVFAKPEGHALHAHATGPSGPVAMSQIGG